MNGNITSSARRVATGFVALTLAVLAAFPAAASAQVRAYFFYGEGCPHCAKERAFLDTLDAEHSAFSIAVFEIYEHSKNVEFLLRAAETLRVSVEGVPFLIIGDQTFVGYADGVTDRAIANRVSACADGSCPDSIAAIVGLPPVKQTSAPVVEAIATNPPPTNEPTPIYAPREETASETVEAPLPPDSSNVLGTIPTTPNAEKNDETAPEIIPTHEESATIFTVPLLGSFDAGSVSLPFLTVVMGFLDGFNPCAMWTLLFLISLLLGMGDRKKMWMLGGVFIMASSAVYLLFMAAWLKLILFLGFIAWIRIAIGGVALIGGAYSLRTFFLKKTNGCEIAGEEGRRKIFERIKKIIHESNFWLALFGIVALAFAVNTVELVCSAGFPAVYTQVLALRQLSIWQYGAYLLLYILFFMLDDLFVFIAAMVTLEMTGVTTKYVRASRLIGGLILFAIGLLLIFKPSWLLF